MTWRRRLSDVCTCGRGECYFFMAKHEQTSLLYITILLPARKRIKLRPRSIGHPQRVKEGDQEPPSFTNNTLSSVSQALTHQGTKDITTTRIACPSNRRCCFFSLFHIFLFPFVWIPICYEVHLSWKRFAQWMSWVSDEMAYGRVHLDDGTHVS